MKIPLALPVLILSAQIAFAGRFDLPKENPQFSIQMPDNWETAVEGDSIVSRPAKDSKVIISVFPVPAAKNLEDAFAIVTKKVSADYRDVKIGKVAEQKQAGLTFFGGQGEGEKDGFELRLSVAAFTADGQRYFALVWAADEVSGETHIKEIDNTLASLRAFKEPPPKAGK
ncbi:MAG: hypothetical protein ABR611_09625 [Chthoniobacterales bacterium]